MRFTSDFRGLQKPCRNSLAAMANEVMIKLPARVRQIAWAVRNDLIEKLADNGDRFLYKPHVAWHANREWTRPFDDILERDRRPGLSKHRILDRRFTLIQFAKSTQRLIGSTAECGVLHGVGTALICRSLQGALSGEDKHFAFDSFEGLPAPTERDRMQSGVHWWKRGSLMADLESVQGFLSQFDSCEVVKGWIPDSLSIACSHKFRFVHVDLDLHEPIRNALEFFYPRMVDGGCLFFDDYGLTSCPGARCAVEEFFRGKPEEIVELATGQAAVYCRRGIRSISDGPHGDV
jgi:O-methyltransferase